MSFNPITPRLKDSHFVRTLSSMTLLKKRVSQNAFYISRPTPLALKPHRASPTIQLAPCPLISLCIILDLVALAIELMPTWAHFTQESTPPNWIWVKIRLNSSPLTNSLYLTSETCFLISKLSIYCVLGCSTIQEVFHAILNHGLQEWTWS